IAVIDQVLIPAVTLVLSHREQNEISDDDTEFVLAVVAETLDQLPSTANAMTPRANIIGLTTRQQADDLVLEMLRTAYGRDRVTLMSHELTAEEAVRAAIRQAPAMICIAAAASTRGSEIRSYCRRIRSESPETRIVVMRPQLPEEEAPRAVDRFREAGADSLVVDAEEAVNAIDRLLLAVAEPASKPRQLPAHA
ncbi:MAG TPA: hypothetical protein VIU34_17130, partial [Steroidobacter sp.]